MLKPNHTSDELSDLLSEYSLLKELDHPNVIKLLGACTDRRGPVFLIMEFAKHGALRDYLRRSREYYEGCRTQSRFSSNTSSSNTSSGFGSGISLEEDVPFIKQKDILGFAWQISKGMAYLAEMKVLHSVTFYCL
jgi:proto-oncogene tyrosine-protein kinase Ret